MKRPATHLVAAAMLIVMSGCGSQSSVQPLEVGLTAPSLELKRVAGSDTFAIESLKGEIVVLNFWSTSCAVCLQEIDDLKDIHDAGKAKVVGIALDQDGRRVQGVIEKRGIEYPVLLGDQETFERFDGYSIPYTLVLDRAQVVRKRFFGRMSEADLDKVLQSLQQPERVALREK